MRLDAVQNWLSEDVQAKRLHPSIDQSCINDMDCIHTVFHIENIVWYLGFQEDGVPDVRLDKVIDHTPAQRVVAMMAAQTDHCRSLVGQSL